MIKSVHDQMIREAAYFLWEKAGRPDGLSEKFWIEACAQFYAPKSSRKASSKQVRQKKENAKT